MGNTIELTCGHCGKRVIIPDGEAGAIYTCPHCSRQNRAARVVQETARSPGSKKVSIWVAIIGWLTLAVVVGWLMAGRNEPTANPRSVNAVAFAAIAEAHGEDFGASAASSESALAEVEDLVSNTKGADLDARIREFARLQAEYERAMAGAVATEREAYEHPERVPLELWRRALDYHQAARRLAAQFLPTWVEGLDMRIEHDRKMIRRFGG